MKIKYLNCAGKKKLFSFHRHDFRQWEDPDTKEVYMIDGGQEDYVRKSVIGTTEEGEISELIGDIREQFTWGQNYDKDMNRLPETKWQKLKDLTTDHIIGIIKYINDREDYNEDIFWSIGQEIFKSELAYRSKNNIL